MELQKKLQSDLKEALRAKDEVKVSTIRFLMASIHNTKIEKGKLSEEDIVSAIQKQIKQSKESIEGYKKGRREELVKEGSREIEILQEYLPEQMSDSDIEILVDREIKDTSSSTIQDIGKVMVKVSSELRGKADMGTVSGLVKNKLS